VNCNSGKYCPSTTEGETICPTGTYNGAGSKTKCTACPAAKKCSATTASNCDADEYSALGDSACHTCPAGYDCNGDMPVPCAAGTYNNGASKSCTDCPPNKFCPSTTSSNGGQQTCADGSYSTGKLMACIECPPGNKCTGGVKSACVSN